MQNFNFIRLTGLTFLFLSAILTFCYSTLPKIEAKCGRVCEKAGLQLKLITFNQCFPYLDSGGQLMIYDIYGKIVNNQFTSGEKLVVPIDSYLPNIYLYKYFSANGEIQIGRFVKN